MYDFPANPVEGQKFTPPGGPTYVFATPVWKFDTPTTFPPTLPIPQSGVTNLPADLAARPTEAPSDANAYGRKANTWVDIAEEAPADGITYGRKNGTWVASIGGATISDTAPPPPLVQGQLWLESDSGALYVWFDDGTSTQWIQVAGPMPAQASQYVRNDQSQTAAGPLTLTAGPLTVAGQKFPTAESYNRVVNPAMQHSQEWNFAASTTTSPWYPFDQWQAYMGASGAAWNVTPAAAVTPNGSKYRLRIAITTPKASLGTTDFVSAFQTIEGNRVADLKFGSAAARQIIVRFGFKGPAGTYAIAIGNTTPNRLFASNFTISAGQANSDTVQTVIIPGDVAGTWATDISIGLYLYVILATGSANVGADRTWSTTAYAGTGITNNIAATNTFELFDVGLYLDPLNTGLPPPWVAPDFASELLSCQRYFQNDIVTNWSGNPVSGALYTAVTMTRVSMRTAPACSGVHNFATGFPTTAGSIGMITNSALEENRTANSTANGGRFRSVVTANARM